MANVNKEIMKLVPVKIKISMLPAFFNHTDAERIGTVIKDTSSQFLIDTQKKVKFSVAVKIFAYNSGVNSVRVVLVKFQEFQGATDGGEGGDGASSKRSKSKKSKSQKSKSQKSQAGEKDPQDAPPKQN